MHRHPHGRNIFLEQPHGLLDQSLPWSLFEIMSHKMPIAVPKLFSV